MKPKIVTIGVYGFDEAGFFRALQDAKVDTFCDIRQRRGVRGAAYAFVNSQRLQGRLAELGIHYLHRKDLAPTKSVREVQAEADKVKKTAKRQRTKLGEAFIEAYQTECLTHFKPQSLLDDLEPDARVVALFCVEREPGACHRSLVAEVIEKKLNLDVEHIVPAS
jgi:uncharacterized protein (DUF488 family)